MKSVVKALLRSLYRMLPFKAALFNAVRGRIRLPERVYQHFSFDGEFSVSLTSGQSLNLLAGVGFAVENSLFWAGFGKDWEAISLRAWESLVPRARFIVDVGANTGIYSLVGRALNPEGKIIAFEPVPKVFERLKLNVKNNGFDIGLERKALSDRRATMRMHDPNDTASYGASLDENLYERAKTFCVETISLDEYVATQLLPSPDLLKIDVEAHEPAVLRGMARILEESHPTMLIEVLNDDLARQIETLVSGINYVFYSIHERDGLHPAPHVEPIGGHNRNVLICTPEACEAASLARFLA